MEHWIEQARPFILEIQRCPCSAVNRSDITFIDWVRCTPMSPHCHLAFDTNAPAPSPSLCNYREVLRSVGRDIASC
jgi:hypothetical protein